MNVGKHEQDGVLPISLHSALGPHGDGIHGFVTTDGTVNKHKTYIKIQ